MISDTPSQTAAALRHMVLFLDTSAQVPSAHLFFKKSRRHIITLGSRRAVTSRADDMAVALRRPSDRPEAVTVVRRYRVTVLAE